MFFGHAGARCAGGGGMVWVRAVAFGWHTGSLKKGQLLLPSLGGESYRGINDCTLRSVCVRNAKAKNHIRSVLLRCLFLSR